MSRTDLNIDQQVPYYQRYVTETIPWPGSILSYSRTESNGVQTPNGRNKQIRTGQVTFRYQDFLNRHEFVPPLPFAFSKIWYQPRQGHRCTINDNSNLKYTRKTYMTGATGDIKEVNSGLAKPSAAIIANLSSQCQQKALLKVKDQDVNLAEMWGERHETLKMIGDNANRIGKSYAALRHGDFRGAAAALGVHAPASGFGSMWRRNQSKAIANGWLELQYGWRPLVMDVMGGLEFLKKNGESPKTKIMRAVAVVKFSDETVTSTSLAPSVGTKIRTRRYDIEMKTCLYYRRKYDVLPTLSSLGITNPAFLAWELMKYSFVVDWFVHVGNYLSSLDAWLGYDWAWGCTTQGVLASEELVYSIHGRDSGGTLWDEDTWTKEESLDITRANLGSWPVLNFPAFKDPRSLEHALNAIALLHQSIRR
jgi:hypothetical protein